MTMKKQLLLLITASIWIFTSCENLSKKSSSVESIDYSDKSVLDSLIKHKPYSTDTMFLGFRIGMTKDEYKNHIKKLRTEGKKIVYSSSNNFSSAFGNFNLGAGYTFKTSISTKLSDKTLTGEGHYFLEPVYNQAGNLMQLNILPIEKWHGDYGIDKPDWLKAKIIESSNRFTNKELKQALIDNEFINSYHLIRQKDNLVIYESSLTMSYVDLKTLLIDLLIKETEKEIIEEKNKDIQF